MRELEEDKQNRQFMRWLTPLKCALYNIKPFRWTYVKIHDGILYKDGIEVESLHD